MRTEKSKKNRNYGLYNLSTQSIFYEVIFGKFDFLSDKYKQWVKFSIVN